MKSIHIICLAASLVFQPMNTLPALATPATQEDCRDMVEDHLQHCLTRGPSSPIAEVYGHQNSCYDRRDEGEEYCNGLAAKTGAKTPGVNWQFEQEIEKVQQPN